MMGWGSVRAALLAGCMLAATVGELRAEDEEGRGWNYGAERGPDHWAEIDPGFATCRTGQRQSPVNIPGDVVAGTMPLSFDYKSGPATIVNLGHTLQVNVAPGSKLRFSGETYELLQFHFHTPSENTFGGLHYPLEIHLVHRSEEGKLAVVSLMAEPGASGPVDELPLPEHVGNSEALAMPLDPAALLPADTSHFAFDGSLTTPPCSEGVQWIVIRAQMTAAQETLSHVAAIMGRTNRPTQPLNGRIVRASE